jgi:hypothetical protein
LYPGHENYGPKGKGDFIEVMTFHINQIGGKREVFRIFGPLWQALMRLANMAFQRKPELLEYKAENKSVRVGKKRKREGGDGGSKGKRTRKSA